MLFFLPSPPPPPPPPPPQPQPPPHHLSRILQHIHNPCVYFIFRGLCVVFLFLKK